MCSDTSSRGTGEECPRHLARNRPCAVARPRIAVDSDVLHEESTTEGQATGCNPVHQITPIASTLTIPGEAVALTARHDTSITHHPPLPAVPPGAGAVLCRNLIRGHSRETALDDAGQNRMPKVRAALQPPGYETLVPSGSAPQPAVHFVHGGPSFGDALAGKLNTRG